MDEHDELPTDPDGDQQLYRDPDVLRVCYHQSGLTLRETAERLGCSATTVGEWMERLGIKRRDASVHKRCEPAHFRTHQGYERWFTTVEGTTKSELVHRLLAVAEHGLDAVAGNHVHHRNGISWDNRPTNLAVLAPDEHLRSEAAKRSRDRGRFAPESNARSRTSNVHRTAEAVTKDGGRDSFEHPWRDPDLLRHLYIDRQRSTLDVAERLECSPSTIREWLERHDIKRRSLREAQLVRVRREPVPFETRPPHAKDAGYEFWHYSYRRGDSDGEQSWIPVHRLLAVSEFGFEAVRGNDVHHINGIRWDNRPDNITLLPREHHARLTRVRERRRTR